MINIFHLGRYFTIREGHYTSGDSDTLMQWFPTFQIYRPILEQAMRKRPQSLNILYTFLFSLTNCHILRFIREVAVHSVNI